MSLTPLFRTRSSVDGKSLVPLRDEFFGPFDDLFNDFANSFFGGSSPVQPLLTKRAYPKVDVFRENADLVFHAAVPGMKREQLSVTLEDGVLSISGESQTSRQDNEECCSEDRCSYIKELKRSSFVRRFTLPPQLPITSIGAAEAKLEDGVLEIRFADVYNEVTEEPKATEIPIK